MDNVECHLIEVPYSDGAICLLKDDDRYELLTFDSGIPEMWADWLRDIGLKPIRFRSYRDDDNVRHWFRISSDGEVRSMPTSGVLFDHRKHKARAEKAVIEVFEGD